MKVVINRCFGGFGLSEEATDALLQRKGIQFQKINRSKFIVHYYQADIEPSNETYINTLEYFNDRTDPDLIAVVEQFGKQANDRNAELKIIEIPNDVKWQIGENDGLEWIAEKHRTWS